MQRLEVSVAIRPLYGSLGFKGLSDLDQFGSKVLAMSGRNPKDRRSTNEVWVNLDESVLIFSKILNEFFYITLKKLKLAFNVEYV